MRRKSSRRSVTKATDTASATELKIAEPDPVVAFQMGKQSRLSIRALRVGFPSRIACEHGDDAKNTSVEPAQG